MSAPRQDCDPETDYPCNQVPVHEDTIKTRNFFIGCAIFVAIGVVMSLALPFYVRAKTRDPTQKRTNGCLAFGLSWLAILYMWISWSTFYQAQIYPYKTITPKIETTVEE